MDARVVRTRTALTHALLELIQQKRWERITVQDLLDRTGVSRSTFYAHYENKLDVLTSDIPDVASTIAVGDDGTIDLLPLFAHVDEMSSVMRPLLSQPVLGEITATFEDGLCRAFGALVDEDADPCLARFLAGALMSTMRSYVADRHRPAPERVADDVNRYVARLLAA